MDTNVAGLNKVYCFTNSSSHNGHTVTISDGVNTWSKVIDNLSCVFMIPSMPAPAKRTYTVTLYNGDTTAAASYTRQIELGFGDSLRIGLYTDDELVRNGTIPTASSTHKGGVMISDNHSDNGLYMNGNYLQLITASSSQKGGVKLGNNMSVSSAVINPNNIEYGTSSKTSGSSSLTAGRIYCQYE